MLSFENDYTAGAHPLVLQRLTETNLESAPGYGSDPFCASARDKIRAALGRPEADVFFISGGTQTNAVVISSLLRSHEGVYAATTGHISVHEAGAIEYSGHKVLELPQEQGRISAVDLRRSLESFHSNPDRAHMVYPGMVYISHPTEYGTLYSLRQLEDIAAVCRDYAIPLFLDGARLGYGLMSEDTDVTLSDIARLCDVFYIGGTKVGALCGEAVVFPKGDMPPHFLTLAKQRGALLAKGRLLGVQFDALFTDDLYFTISRHAIRMARQLKELFLEKGYALYLDSPTNQQFVILSRSQMEVLSRHVAFCFWEWVDEDKAAVRFATSWSTTEEDLARLRNLL